MWRFRRIYYDDGDILFFLCIDHKNSLPTRTTMTKTTRWIKLFYIKFERQIYVKTSPPNTFRIFMSSYLYKIRRNLLSVLWCPGTPSNLSTNTDPSVYIFRLFWTELETSMICIEPSLWKIPHTPLFRQLQSRKRLLSLLTLFCFITSRSFNLLTLWSRSSILKIMKITLYSVWYSNG